MKKFTITLSNLKRSSSLSLLLILSFVTRLTARFEYSEQWPGFRGPYASGIMDNASLVSNWDIQTGKNIKWRTPIPGLGHSCPVIWGSYIFISTAISGSGKDSLKIRLYGDIDMADDESIHEFRVYCLDKYTGKIIWERTAHKGVPRTRRHTKSSHANPTPVCNGKYILVMFNSEGLYCYDLHGELKWKKDFGTLSAGPCTDPEVEWGFGSSPVIHGDKFVIQSDVTGPDFLGGYELETGKEVWKVERDEVTTWSTPTIYEKDGKSRILVNGYRHIGAYDFDTGGEIWRMSGGGDAPVPTPVVAHGLIFINNAHGPEYHLLARNSLEDICMATPAISEGVLFFRTKNYLIAVGEVLQKYSSLDH